MGRNGGIMKQIFKKNQIIITALALMLCAAGYLQFSSKGDESDLADGIQGNYSTAQNDSNTENGFTVKVNSGIDTAKNNSEDFVETASNDKNEEGGEDDHQVGDAVMVSTTLQANFTTNARLVREQRRAQSKETLMGIIDNSSLSEEQKENAVETLVSLTAIAEKESAAELLLEAKGFADAIVNIVDNQVDVVINAESVTDQQIAQIEDIVTRKTGFEPANIKITAAIQED